MAVLVFVFLWKLGKCKAPALRDKDAVVSETSGAAFLGSDMAFTDSFCADHPAVRIHKGDGADEGRCAFFVRKSFQLL